MLTYQVREFGCLVSSIDYYALSGLCEFMAKILLHFPQNSPGLLCCQKPWRCPKDQKTLPKKALSRGLFSERLLLLVFPVSGRARVRGVDFDYSSHSQNLGAHGCKLVASRN